MRASSFVSSNERDSPERVRLGIVLFASSFFVSSIRNASSLFMIMWKSLFKRSVRENAHGDSLVLSLLV